MRITLAFLLPTARFLAVSPFVYYGYLAVTFLISRWSMHRMRAKRDKELALTDNNPK